MTVDASTADGATVSDTATVTNVNETDTNNGNDSATENTTVQRRVDLQVSKTESIDPVVAGSGAGNLVYVVTAFNAGPSDATGVTLSEDLTLPSGVTRSSVVPSAGSFVDTAAPDGTWTLDLTVGASATLTVTLSADLSTAMGTDVISNTATVTGANETVINTGDDTATQATSVIALDFGDAPTAAQAGGGTFVSDYPTTRANTGARHVKVGPTLGPNRDIEVDGIPDANALGDDNDDTDDEDGVTFVSTLVSDPSATTQSALTVNLQNADPGSNRLDAWIDFNRDGDWLDSGEQIFTHQTLTSGDNTLAFTIAANASIGDTFARFRLSTVGNLAPTGLATDGEVEDYLVEIIALGATADGSVTLPSGGGITEIVVEGGSVIVRRNGVVLLQVPVGALNTLTITGTDGQDDAFRIDLSGDLPGTLNVNGGTGGNDTLELVNGSADTVIYGFTNPNDGDVQVDFDGDTTIDTTVNYTGLEPITSTINATNVTLNYGATAETITVTDATGGKTTVASTAGETVTFNNPTGTLTINGGAGADAINITSLAADYPAHVTINGQGDTDTVAFDGNVSLAVDKNLSVTADTINVNSTLSASGIGSITLEAARNIDMNSGSSITTVNGAITLEANPAGAVTGSFVGIDLDGVTLSSTGTGAITVSGRGGDTSGDDGVAIDGSTLRVADGNLRILGNAGNGTGSSDGVDIGTNSVIEASGLAAITIVGTSGSGSSSDGVEISDSAILSVNGMISIHGDASHAGNSADGVELDDSSITSQGGAIQIVGNSEQAGSSADGIDINDSIVQSATGPIQLTGIATGAGSSADGVELAAGAIIQTTDTGPITILGTG
ncbi:MAG: hypothetical protein IIA44_11015, partial [Acidobacteria bacterium]|nr:hypothetical protein [Acidobacteriota bacterium]